MNLKYQNEAKKMLEVINSVESVLLHCHPSVDADSLGGVLAMKSALEKMGKKVTAIEGDSEIKDSLFCMPGSENVVKKNITEIKLEDYDAFIVLDSSDKGRITRLKEIVFPEKMHVMIVDHHQGSKTYGEVNIIDNKSSSTCEILFHIFKNWCIEIDRDMALNLFLGIGADTGGFKYKTCSTDTFEVASQLTAIRPDYHDYVMRVENELRPNELVMMGVALQHIEKHFDELLVFSFVDWSEVEARKLTREEALDGLIPDLLRNVKGWTIVASLVEVRPGEVIMTLRSKDEEKYDVSEIARKLGVGGGGHKGAAGTTIRSNMEDAKQQLIEFVRVNYLR